MLQRLPSSLLRDAQSALPRASRSRNATAPLRSTRIRTYVPGQSLPASDASSTTTNTPQHPPPLMDSRSSAAQMWETIIGASASSIKEPAKPDSPEKIWKANHDTFMATMTRVNDAYSGKCLSELTGRSIPVLGGNIDQAYKYLESRLNRNRVKAEVRYQERHEKKGIKRNRLKSERWRRRFAHEVRKKIQLVNAIRRTGS
ncbi:hypothetical protein OE88DRAFT_1642206 [Heliocybe sulcata]|uniref:Ribosomal protein S21 n=1 Tax=Heliocybe sulcata TaxID=5364 RepID=A0A5C3NDH1_9AGAM|nr:hypothetical protein OE88DRAFT_1642206 [Heliocybe sulcata]